MGAVSAPGCSGEANAPGSADGADGSEFLRAKMLFKFFFFFASIAQKLFASEEMGQNRGRKGDVAVLAAGTVYADKFPEGPEFPGELLHLLLTPSIATSGCGDGRSPHFTVASSNPSETKRGGRHQAAPPLLSWVAWGWTPRCLLPSWTMGNDTFSSKVKPRRPGGSADGAVWPREDGYRVLQGCTHLLHALPAWGELGEASGPVQPLLAHGAAPK